MHYQTFMLLSYPSVYSLLQLGMRHAIVPKPIGGMASSENARQVTTYHPGDKARSAKHTTCTVAWSWLGTLELLGSPPKKMKC